ncbi:hypothetical protein EYF80_068297 [Liparis tanakae]|uniref:Uncharacterized protein n=1 Tax=Liparis tanakae TaxID=230148 RepID=A0A4Z2DYF0_9TELE|nr:hypothetical protein EYF80_068297 [Liparis tanakae]
MPPKHSFCRAQYAVSRCVFPSPSTVHHSQSSTPKQSLPWRRTGLDAGREVNNVKTGVQRTKRDLSHTSHCGHLGAPCCRVHVNGGGRLKLGAPFLNL